MSGILRLESLTKGNTLKQGDKTPLKYRLFDADGEKLNIAGKTAKVRLVYPDFLTIGYEKDGLTVAQDDTVTFTIDGVIPSRIYHVEIIVDGQFIFPSRADESKFTVDKSSLGAETNIIEIVGVDQIVSKVLDKVDADVGQVVENINATNESIKQAEAVRVQAESERSENYENYSQQFNDINTKLNEGLALVKNELKNGDFSQGTDGWESTNSSLSLEDGSLKVTRTRTALSSIRAYQVPFNFVAGHKYLIKLNNFSQSGIGNAEPSLLANDESGDTYTFARMPNSLTVEEFHTTFTSTQKSTAFYIYVYLTELGDYFTLENISILDLTKLFGEGNEPELEVANRIIDIAFGGKLKDEQFLNNLQLLNFYLSNNPTPEEDPEEDVGGTDTVKYPVETLDVSGTDRPVIYLDSSYISDYGVSFNYAPNVSSDDLPTNTGYVFFAYKNSTNYLQLDYTRSFKRFNITNVVDGVSTSLTCRPMSLKADDVVHIYLKMEQGVGMFIGFYLNGESKIEHLFTDVDLVNNFTHMTFGFRMRSTTQIDGNHNPLSVYNDIKLEEDATNVVEHLNGVII